MTTVPTLSDNNNPFRGLQLSLQFQQDFLGTWERAWRQHGDFFVLEIGGSRNYTIIHPEHVREALITHAAHFEKDTSYTDPQYGLARFLGTGLLTSNGEFWRKQRKLVSPALHTQRIANYADTMTRFAVEISDGWQNGQTKDIAHEMMVLTLRIVMKSLLNTEVQSEIDTIYKATEALQAGFGTFLPQWVPTPARMSAPQRLADLNAFIYPLISRRRAENHDQGDLLSMLIDARDDENNGMTDQQVRDEAVTLFMAGHETTANTLNWTFTLLAQNPQAEAKLHAELDAVLGGRVPTFSDLRQLPYTDMVIKEAMRLYPPAWSFGRVALKDVEVAGQTIHKGENIIVFPYFTHRHPDLWEQPEAFIPERFNPENEAKIDKWAYYPFGGGQRVCVGQSFAQMEAILLLATIASRARLRFKPGHVVQPQALITLFPKGGLPMVIERRTPQPLHAGGEHALV